MNCLYGCGRRSHEQLDTCVPCYRLVHGQKTASKILQLIKKKQCSENESIFKVERFLLESRLDYLKNRLRHILEGMCTDDCWRYSRMFLRKMKRVPLDLLVSLNRFYQADPPNDEELMDELDNELSFYSARRYSRSSSDEETVAVVSGNNETDVATFSGKPQKRKRKCSPDRVFQNAEIQNKENEEHCEPPKKRHAQKIESDIESSNDQMEELNIEDEAPVQIVPIFKNSNFRRRGKQSVGRPRDEKGCFVKCPFSLPSHKSKKARKTEVDKLTESSFLGVGVDPYTLLRLPSLTRSGLQFH